MQAKSNKTDCTFIRDNLFSYVEEQLPEKKRKEFEEHLDSCKDCSMVVSGFKSVSSFIDKKKSVEPNPFTRTRILQRIENEIASGQNESSPFLLRVIRPISFSFIFLLATAIGFALGKQNGTSYSNTKNAPNDIQTLKSELNIPDFIDEDKMLSDIH
jgi:hypothetical protein